DPAATSLSCFSVAISGSRRCSAAGKLNRSSFNNRRSAGTPRNAIIAWLPSTIFRSPVVYCPLPGGRWRCSSRSATAVASTRRRVRGEVPREHALLDLIHQRTDGCRRVRKQQRGHVAVLADRPDRVHVLRQRDQPHRL